MSSYTPPTYYFNSIDFNPSFYKVDVSGYALDNTVVHKLQNETISGAKSFTGITSLATTNVSQISLGFGNQNNPLMLYGDTTTGNGARIYFGTSQANLTLMARHSSIPQINLTTNVGGTIVNQLIAKSAGVCINNLIGTGVRAVNCDATGLLVNTSPASLGATTLSGTGNRAVYSDATGVLTNTASDFRLKENIQLIPETDMLLKVLQLEPKTFNWKSTGEYDFGFIAQEVNDILPQLVVERNDGFYSVNYDRIPTLLVCCIKQLQEQINDLKLQVALLQN